MASREEGKDLRRRTILNAARDLISGQEETGFSMRALSERAGVSITTPYNLLGSKQAIMQTLLDEDIRKFSDGLHQSSRNELELFFEAVTQGVEAFAADISYYRAVMAAVYQEGGTQYRSTFRGPRRLFWRELVQNAIDGGYLSAVIAAEPFSLNLAAIFFSNILEWVAGEIDLPELEARTHYGFALALLALADEPHRAYLHRRVIEAQARLCPRASRKRRSTRRAAAGKRA